MKPPRIGADLVEFLKQYPPRCIRSDETPIEAHRYAAKVELAQTLIRMGMRDDEGIIEIQED